MDETTLTTTLISTIAPPLVTLLGGLVTWGVGEGIRLLRTKTKNEQTMSALDYTNDVVIGVVASLENTIKQDFKDGTWTAQEKQRLKDTARLRVIKQVPVAVQKATKLAVDSFTDYVNDKIEEVVLINKKGG